MPDFDVDVLIAGAGPTGLMLATELTALGVSIRIVDRAAVRSDKSRAVIVQSRVLELLDRHGLAQELIGRGTITTGIDVHVYGRQCAAMDIPMHPFDDCPFPVSLLASQADTEDVLSQHLLQSLGGSDSTRTSHPGIERAVKVASVTTNGDEDDDGVTVVLEHGSSSNSGSTAAVVGNSDVAGAVSNEESAAAAAADDNVRSETVRCRYLVGCDGAHSVVRRCAGIPFDGGSYLPSFMLCDTHLDNWPGRVPGRTQMYWDKGFLTLLPYAESKGIVRLIGCKPVPRSAAAQEEHARLTVPTMASFTEYFAETTHFDDGADAPQLKDPVWVTAFRLHHRCAPTYQSGRILIAGDAAHIHSPAGGQGMNAGIGDAVNLGWKLAAIIRTGPATAATALLASYDLERRPVGERLLRTTDQLFTLATTARPFVAWVRNMMIRLLAPYIVRFKSRQRTILGAMSQLRVRYRRSPIVGTAPGWRGTVRGGDRAPDGRVVPLSSDGAGLGELDETWLLHRVWAGDDGAYKGLTSYHLLVFAGQTTAADDDGMGSILDAADTAADIKTGLNATRAHIIAGSTEQAVLLHKAVRGVPVMVDHEQYLHGRYGFGAEPGYALVRPDGHVEHIGRLPFLAQLPAWVADRRCTMVEAAAKSWWW